MLSEPVKAGPVKYVISSSRSKGINTIPIMSLCTLTLFGLIKQLKSSRCKNKKKILYLNKEHLKVSFNVSFHLILSDEDKKNRLIIYSYYELN